ncbi:MAG: branched-chain amino acid ABC transporter permease [Coriobacteriia bacterium]|nr:branched-chain amino acid ABC transporter permease [Coriobacteriia bacterium]
MNTLAVKDWLFRNSTILMLCVILLLFGAFFWWLNNPALEHLFIVTCITLIFVMGFQLFMGNSGILAWSYIGFVGIGAFVSAICSMTPQLKQMSVPIMYPWLQNIHMPLPLALLVGALFSALIAAIVVWPIMRLTGAVGVITHFALLIVINVLLVQWAQVTNGPRNFTVGMRPLVGFWTVLISALVIMVFVYFFKQSSLGLRLRASRDDRFSASTSGVNVVAVRYFAFIISCAIGAYGGGLMAHFIMDFTGHTFYMAEFFVILSMIVIGGPMSVSGVFFGLILVAAGRYGLRQFEPFMTGYGFNMTGTTEIILSILMILFLIWKPYGISGGKEFGLETIQGWLKPLKKGA